MACFVEFWAVFDVCVLTREMLNFPPEMMIWWTLKMYFRQVVNTLSQLWGW